MDRVDAKHFVSMYFQVPITYLCGNVSWLPNKFLMEKLPTLARTIDKKSLQMAEQQRAQYLKEKEASLVK